MRPGVRHIQDGDWAAIAELEAAAYAGSGLSEGRSVLESRGRASPATSFVLDAGGTIAGYVLALPYARSRYPDLTRSQERVRPSSNLHLHDLVIGERFRGTGLTEPLLKHLTAEARSASYERISLIAVADSLGFWSTRRYQVQSDVTLPRSYGANAVYMSREI